MIPDSNKVRAGHERCHRRAAHRRAVAGVHEQRRADAALDAIFGEGDGPWCIFLEADPDDDSDVPSWFAEWIKYIDDMPQGIKDWLEQAHVEPGESVPMFSTGGGDVMTFAYKGMAEKTAEKIADMYPQFKGRLRVTKRLSYEPSEDDRIADGVGQTFSPD